MVNSIFWPLIFAIISPFIWGLVNILDKFVISHKVKNPLSFAVVAGIVALMIGVILSLFLDWKGIVLTSLIFPAAAGIIFGFQYFLYYYILNKEDVSDIIGFEYSYPILVAILSFLFLNEILSLISYLGISLILFGAIMLSLKKKKIKFKISLWILIIFVAIIALYEFFVKISTTNLPEWNGIAISNICLGFTILLGLFNKKIRGKFLTELKNIKWAMLNESLTFLGIVTLFFAMAGLPATIVSSIAATQPFAVLILEFLANKIGMNISVDTNFRKKIIPIFMIVAGVVLIYSKEILSIIFKSSS